MVSKFEARFSGQAWVNDYAIECDPEGPTTWDVTDYFLSDEFTIDQRNRMVHQEAGYDRDRLRDDPSAPEWIQNWRGPFEVYVEEVGGEG